MKRQGWLAVLLVAAIGAALLLHRFGPATRASRGPAAASVRPGAVSPRPRHLSPNGDEPSPIAADLDSPRTDIHGDLRLLNDVFAAYRSATHGLNPVGENREITAALLGRNALGFAFVAPDSPAVNGEGELVDRWGTPFFFHQLAGDEMEIRSAGPDRKLYTADDVTLTPGRQPPHL